MKAKLMVGLVGVGILAGAFLTSTEALLNLVDAYYADFLKRQPDPAGQTAWLASLKTGQMSEDQVAVAFLASAEYFALAQH